MDKEYIEREATIKNICNFCDGWCDKVDCDCVNCKSENRCEFMKDVANQPTADVVEVVRCKECENCKTCTDGEKYCELLSDSWGEEFHYVDDDGYCSYGERKDEK